MAMGSIKSQQQPLSVVSGALEFGADKEIATNNEITPPRSPHSPRSLQNPQSRVIPSKILAALYSDSVYAKIWGVASRAIQKIIGLIFKMQKDPPTEYPEYTLPGGDTYVYSSFDFWTSGFFPGCLYLLDERREKWSRTMISSANGMPKSTQLHPLKLRHACRWWSANLHSQAGRTDTHDLGFMIQPWAQLGWEMSHDIECYDSVVTAAYSLASRFDPRVGCIRSWDTCFTKRYNFDDPQKNFLVIIDNMMNLNLLYYASQLTNDPKLADIATTHAARTMSAHIREDNSTCHVVDFDQVSGKFRSQMTNQGYSDSSCWSRGQAWGIAGFAQTYGWTKDPRFLKTSRNLADYFLAHLPEDSVPHWDFNAPNTNIRDTSAALIAAYGMLLLHSALKDTTLEYLDAALRIVSGVVTISLASEANFVRTSNGDQKVDLGGPETIVLNATINNYEFAPRRWADHGLVYADYYFILIGNTLLEMGLA